MFQKLGTWRGETGCVKSGWGEASDSLGGGCPADSDLKGLGRCMRQGGEGVSLEGLGVKLERQCGDRD